MKTYKLLLIGATALVGLGLAGKHVYDSGIQSGLEKGIQDGRTQMKTAVIGDLRERVDGLKRDINHEEHYTTNPSELEIKTLQAVESELYDLWDQLQSASNDYLITRYSKLEKSE
ncbi:hypothetical protein HON71_02715 [Candidatus Woesearchaeota archaeon]|jgi:hypothetical protein|nr:hypothetical protein [Candidatus Woesearchaeota archaeon]MBT5341982.1 hypothetical protein [Candidatus Woesearchaeota archaeon]